MVNTRQKGRRNELRAKKELESWGYKTYLVRNPHKWSKENDIFGLFDLVAIGKAGVKFVQVKTNRKPNLQKYQNFIDEYGSVDRKISGIVMVWHDRIGWKTYSIFRSKDDK